MSKCSKTKSDMPGTSKSNYYFSLHLAFNKNRPRFTEHHIDSFNQFVKETIPNILQSGENCISEKVSKNKIIKYRFVFDDLEKIHINEQ